MVEMWPQERSREAVMRALNQPIVQDHIRRIVPLALSVCGVGNMGQMEIRWARDGLVEGQVTGFSVAYADRVGITEHIVNGESVFQMYYYGLAGSTPEPLGVPIAAGWRVAIEEFVATLAERAAREHVRQSFAQIKRDATKRPRGSSYSTLPAKRFGM